MAIRADQVLIGAVGLIGLYAVYRLVTNKPRDPSDVPIYRPPGTAPAPLPANLRVPNVLGPDKSARINVNTFVRGRLEDPRPAATVKTELEALGFRNIVVYPSAAEAAPAIPLPDALLSPTPGVTKWFSGVWTNPSVNIVRMPPSTTLLWYAATEPGTGRWAA